VTWAAWPVLQLGHVPTQPAVALVSPIDMAKLSTSLAAIAAVTSLVSVWIMWDEKNEPTLPQLELISDIVTAKSAIVALNRELQYLAWRIKEATPALRESVSTRLSAAELTCGRSSAAAEIYVRTLEKISKQSMTFAEQQEWQIREGVLRSEYSKCAAEVSSLQRLLASNHPA
jgi:hypothetical protein